MAYTIFTGLAKLDRAGADLTPRGSGAAGSPPQPEKADLQDLKARAETDPAAEAELAQQRAQQP